MRKLFNHMDKTFRSAYSNYEDEPSQLVWQNINDRLNVQAQRRLPVFWIKALMVSVMISAALLVADYSLKLPVYEQQGSLKKETGKQPQKSHDKSVVQIKEEKVIQIKKEKNIAAGYPEIKKIETSSFQKESSQIKASIINLSTSYFLPEKNITFSHFEKQQLNFPAPKILNRFKPYWTISPIISYGYAAYRLDSDLPGNYQQVNQIRQREKNELSYSAGILATYHFHKNAALQTGFAYSNTQIQIDPQKIYAFDSPGGETAFQYVTSSGYTYLKPKFSGNPAIGDSLYTTEAKHSFKSISLPLIVKFNIHDRGKIDFHPGAGIAANMIFRSGLETEVTDAMNRETVTIKKLQGTRNFFWSAYADAEIQYKINPGLSINFRPSLSYALSPITDNEIVETFPYSINAGLGITWKF